MIVPATFDHLSRVVVPEASRRELAEVYGMTPEAALRHNFTISVDRWAMTSTDEVLAVFGVYPLSLLNRTGEFWIVSSEAVERHRFSFARQCRSFLPTLMTNWSELRGLLEHNRCDVLRWAQWLGVKTTPRDERMSYMVLEATWPQ